MGCLGAIEGVFSDCVAIYDCQRHVPRLHLVYEKGASGGDNDTGQNISPGWSGLFEEFKEVFGNWVHRLHSEEVILGCPQHHPPILSLAQSPDHSLQSSSLWAQLSSPRQGSRPGSSLSCPAFFCDDHLDL